MDNRYFNSEAETLSADAIINLQEEKLEKQISYLWEKSKFYREKLKNAGAEPGDINTLKDLSRLPFTEKQELRDSQVQAPPLGTHAAVPMKDVIRIYASSGTTGTPSYVGVTRMDDEVWTEAVARAYWAQGLRPGSIFAMGFGIGFFVGGIPVCNGVHKIGSTFLPIGVGASDRLIESIASNRADTLACTPSYASYLAEYASAKMNIDPRDLGIKKLMVGAEPGGGIPEFRSHLEEAWGAHVTECVGNADVVPIHSAECEYQDGNHFLLPDHLILEIIDPNTGAVIPVDGDNVEGEMVFTHLGRQCGAHLRFRTRDHVVIKTSPCPCGRTGIRLKVIGRTDDLMIMRGVNIWPSAVKDLVMSFRPRTTGVMRIVLDAPGPQVSSPLKIEIEASAGLKDSQSLKREIEKLLRNKLIFTSDVSIVPANSLPRTEMKTKLIHKTYDV
ncbi:MAG: phenylacetate--CoA ligase [Robiginitomaculum sp.]|nr:MAG: phenylacetate--CoA ligase [Robiginitomaculum sp.]